MLRYLYREIKRFILNHSILSAIFSILGVLLILLWVSNKEEVFWKQGIFTAQNLILLFTFGAIVWYSIETRLLKNATNIANSIQAEPLLVFKARNDDLYIVNEGKGVAFNVRMETQNIVGRFGFVLPDPNPLAHQEEKLLERNYSGSDNLKARVTLSWNKIEGDVLVSRERIYSIIRARRGYYIYLEG